MTTSTINSRTASGTTSRIISKTTSRTASRRILSIALLKSWMTQPKAKHQGQYKGQHWWQKNGQHQGKHQRQHKEHHLGKFREQYQVQHKNSLNTISCELIVISLVLTSNELSSSLLAWLKLAKLSCWYCSPHLVLTWELSREPIGL